jgi:4-carboxymuconolactone decarboxylase
LHPEVTAKLLGFQAAESTSTGLSPSVREVVIIVLGAVYGADYELYAHMSVARTAGLADDHVVALSGETSRMAWASTRSSLPGSPRRWRRVTTIDDELYQDTESAFGEKGLFDIAAVMGVYHTVCTMLTLFEVPAP